MEIEKFKSIKEMDEEQKKKFYEIVFNRCRKSLNNYFQSNKDFFTKKLSGNTSQLFQKEVLKHDHLELPFFSQLLDLCDDKREEKLINKAIKSLFKDDPVLAKAIAERKFERENLLVFLSKQTEEERKEILDFLSCLGIDADFTSKEYNEVKQQETIKSLEKQLSEKEKEIGNLKDAAKKDKDEHEKKLKDIKDENKKQLKEKDEEIKKLTKERDDAVNKASSINVSKEAEEEVVKREDQEINEPSLPKQPDIESFLNDFEKRTMLGVVKAEGIQVAKNWVIINPIVPLINDNAPINRDELYKRVDYRGDYSTLVLYLSQSVLDLVLSPDDAYSYAYMSNDDKYRCLYDAFCKKIIFFAPKLYGDGNNNRYKLNAFLLSKPIPYEDFSYSTFIPFFDASKKDFEGRIGRHEDLVLDNYPSTLSSALKYIYVKDTIYEINYIPDGQNTDKKYTRWKYNGQEGKEPFRKLDLKITEASSDKYILVPNCIDQANDLYIKTISLIKSPTKSNPIFDEAEFIDCVSKNAKSKNLYYSENDLKTFHVALKSSNLVILAGPSGIGKTKLPLVYADTLGLDTARNTILFVPISPSYLEPEDVLGYVRPLSENNNETNAEYVESQTGLVSFLIDAAEHKDKIHLVVFDEMNLSQIEHWFAPFISLLEQDPDARELKLYSSNLNMKNGDKYPSSINIGENVFFIGTVNIDETTKQISDRLLDRAIVINLSAPVFTNLKEMEHVDSDTYQEIAFSRFATAIKKVGNSTEEFSSNEFALINDLNNVLTNPSFNQSISFRSLNKMALFLKNSKDILSRSDALDFIVNQIVIKKINGSREELEDILSDDDTKGLLMVLNQYASLSNFTEAKKAIKQKYIEISKYGFTK